MRSMQVSSFLLNLLFPLVCFSVDFSYVDKENLSAKIEEILGRGEVIKAVSPADPKIEAYDYLIVFTGKESFNFPDEVQAD
jgi:hypothetical protein